jgi:hypothetical protein
VLLRLPSRALAAPQNQQPHRIHVLVGAAADPGDQGPRQQGRRLAMAFKLLEAAQQRWRAVNGPHLVALVRAGARFEKGKLVERGQPHQQAAA